MPQDGGSAGIPMGAEMDTLLKAYEDVKFLKRDELRSVRLQLELLKPELIMSDQNVASTVVIFGSARTLPPDVAEERFCQALKAAADDPGSSLLHAAVQRAQHDREASKYYQLARDFAAEISKLGQPYGPLEYVVTTGGGPGIMEAANRGAYDVGAKSIGLNITLPHEQSANPYISEELNFLFHYFSIRKMHFLLRAKALCAFPGGYGTMDELFETLTLIQTNKSARIPVLLYGREFWEELINWDALVKWGMISPDDLDLFSYVDSVEEGLQLILDFYKL